MDFNRNMHFMDSVLSFSDMKYDALCKQIINDMNTYGMCVVDDFLGNKYGLDILREGNTHFQSACASFNYELVFSFSSSAWAL